MWIPTPLRRYCGGTIEIEIEAGDVRSILKELEAHHPALYGNICDEAGNVRRHINLFVNSDHIRDCHGLDTRLESGDIVTIMTAVSGG